MKFRNAQRNMSGELVELDRTVQVWSESRRDPKKFVGLLKRGDFYMILSNKDHRIWYKVITKFGLGWIS